jgi:hypothetical protein
MRDTVGSGGGGRSRYTVTIFFSLLSDFYVFYREKKQLHQSSENKLVFLQICPNRVRINLKKV